MTDKLEILGKKLKEIEGSILFLQNELAKGLNKKEQKGGDKPDVRVDCVYGYPNLLWAEIREYKENQFVFITKIGMQNVPKGFTSIEWSDNFLSVELCRDAIRANKDAKAPFKIKFNISGKIIQGFENIFENGVLELYINLTDSDKLTIKNIIL
jgi:hypothetical protein